MTRLEDRLARLATMSPAELRAEWERVYGTPAPRLSADLLRLGTAYRLQEKALGKLPARVLRSLRQRTPAPSIKPGTQLVRSWNGRTVAVLVTATGYLFEDDEYGSLTAVARKVTGAGWSGPRFFGLNANG